MRSIGLGAAAAIAVVAADPRPAAATPVSVQSISWEFYQGGYVQTDPNNFDVVQDTFANLPTRTVTSTVGGSTFTSIASIQNTTLNNAESFLFTSVATLRAEASVTTEFPQGMAEAFAGLSLLTVAFEVTGEPAMYMGSEPLEHPNGPFFSGDTLNPGLYEFVYFHPLILDAHANALPGDSTFDEVTRTFNFEFVVPAPGAAMLALPAALLIGRRRR